MTWATFIAYLTYVIKHKYYVYKVCRVLGVGIYQALMHDWTKFKYSEYWPYAKYFYGMVSNCPAVKEGLSKDMEVAWNYHQKHNRHHWQYWVLLKDSGELKPLRIPNHYVREMVADWIGVGLALNQSKSAKQWYDENKGKMIMHPDTRADVESILAEYSAKTDSDSGKAKN